jgi:hypothetical protein
MDDADVVDNSSTERRDAEQEGGNGGHDEGFITADTHVPEREIPDQQAQAGQDGPEGEAKIDISQGVQHVALGIGGSKHVPDGFVLFRLGKLIDHSLVGTVGRSG